MSNAVLNKFLRKVTVNLIEICNFSCSFCPISEGYGSRDHKMNIETAKTIAAQLQGFPGSVSLTSRGESFLHPEIDRLLDVFDTKSRSYRLKISHNSSMIDQITERLERFDDVELMVYRDEDREMALSYQDEHKSWWQDVDVHELLTQNQVDKFCNNRAGTIAIPNLEGIVEPCYIPIMHLMIHWNGSYLLCCHDWGCQKQFGNVFDTEIANFYLKNESYRQYCQQLYRGNRQNLEPCKHCNKISPPFKTAGLIRELHK